MATENSTPERTYCVYRIVCFPTGKVYVGMTKHPHKRHKEHFQSLKYGIHPNERLQWAYNKHGKNTFYFEVIERDLTYAEANEREIHWIENFNSFRDGFNNTKGGDAGKGRGIPCVWNGITYDSVAAAARANGIDKAPMYERLAKGYTCDEDMLYYKAIEKPVMWNDIEYPSRVHAAKALGISVNTFHHRLKQGYTCDEDVKEIGTGALVECVWNGITYKSIAKCARANGVIPTEMRRRLNKGYTCDRDLTGSGLNNAHKCTWNGIEYPSISAAARANNMNQGVMNARLKRGWTCDEDISKNR